MCGASIAGFRRPPVVHADSVAGTARSPDRDHLHTLGTGLEAAHGVVRDPAIHREVLERVTDHAATLGIGTRHVIASPIHGHDGNREFLVHLAHGPGCADLAARVSEVTGA